MANTDSTKKSVKGLSPIEAGFVRFFENMEVAFKKINENYNKIEMPDPTTQAKPVVRRHPNRPVYDHLQQTPWGGGIIGE